MKLNRRRVDRVTTPLSVKWVEGSGTTRNISEMGIQFATEDLVEVGNMIKLAVSIPSGPDMDQTVHALCDATVIRVEHAAPSGTMFNVAAAFEKMTFH